MTKKSLPQVQEFLPNIADPQIRMALMKTVHGKVIAKDQFKWPTSDVQKVLDKSPETLEESGDQIWTIFG